MLKCYQPRGRKVADNPPKGPQSQSIPDGGRKAMTMMIVTMMMIIMMMILMMTMVIVISFLHPIGLAPGGQQTIMIMMIRMVMTMTKMMMMMIFFNKQFLVGFKYLKLQ